MKSKFLSLPLCIASIGSPVIADDFDKGFYGNLNIGLGKYSDLAVLGSLSTINFATGFEYEVGLGYDFGKRFRTEVNYTNTSSDIDTISGVNSSSDTTFSTIGVMGYLDFPLKDSKWEPFIGAGIGSTKSKTGTICAVNCISGREDTHSSYTLAAGTNYSLNEKTDILTKFTYRGFGDIDLNDYGIIKNSETVSFDIGLRFKF